MKWAGKFAVALLATVVIASATSDLWGAIYIRSTAGPPWGVGTNEAAMDTVFGSGSWQDLRYETLDPNAVFSGANDFVFLEGGDDNANELEAFLLSNQSTIEGWVASGGALLINSAPNEGNGMSYGFGGVLLNYQDFSVNPVSAVDPAHPIFTGPFTPVATAYNGNYFGHASLTGPGINPLMTDQTGAVYLAEKNWNDGYVMFGGLTTTNWHQPGTEASNLRANMLHFAASQAQANVPEPASMAIWGMGGLGLAWGARRRRRRAATR